MLNHGSSGIRISLPEDVINIIKKINTAGYEAYAVGGCVRDSILGREPGDYDITTSATPEEVKRIFKRTVDTGIQHGTVTVLIGNEGYEVTTYRIDGKYEDNRHPESVEFTRSLKEDLLRRDFTINAMAYNDDEGLVDLFGGIDDIEAKVIRCVGNPNERLSEDALRILRAVRFAAQLGYEIDQDTVDAMRHLAPNLKDISKERIEVELLKMVTSPHPEIMRTAYEIGITKVFLPEFDAMMETAQNHPHHMYSVGEHTIHAMQEIEPNKYLRLAMLFHDIGKPRCKTQDDDGTDHFHGHPEVSYAMSKDILRRLKFDNNTIDIVSRLARYHDIKSDSTKRSVRRMIHKVGDDIFLMLLDVKRADVMAQSLYQREQKLEDIVITRRLYEEIKADKECLSIKDLKINGQDLMGIGYPQGACIGQELKRLLELVLDDPAINDKDVLRKKAAEDLDEIRRL